MPCPSPEEIAVLDLALSLIRIDPERAKSLLTGFLLSALSPSEFGKETKFKKRGRTRRTIATSKRKAKRKNMPDYKLSTKRIGNTPPFILSDNDITEDLFITPQEIYNAKLPLKSSSGPDGASVKTLNKIPIRCRCKIYTAFLLLRWVPNFLLDSRTVFLPKKENTSKPSMLRPLSISSTMLRQFHKVLAKRLMAVLDPALDMYQFGFRQMDGIAEAVHLFDQMIQRACTNFNTIAVAVLDIEKAFDSVSHDAIFEALQKINISPVIKDYLKFTYAHAKTFLCFNGSIKSEPVRPTRGVRQGDPMSPLLFLLVFDQVLNAIPDYEGFLIESKRINHIAFADDLVLVADSMIGLNNIINRILPALTWSGLNISVEKSATFIWMADCKRKRVVYDSTSSLKIRNRPVNILRVDDEFKYLGVWFTPRGRTKYTADLEEKLQILQKALLRPQQKLFFSVKNLLPGLYHQLSFAKLYAGSLRKLDVKVRRFVRTILHLPKDVPTAAFHARVSDGGLGIPSLRWMAPLLAAKRGNSKEHMLLKYEGKQLRTANAIYNMFRRQWQSTCDGCGLKGSSDVPSAHSWVLDGTSLLSGRDYISCIHVRLGVLFNRARATRGRKKQHLCARGCYQPETLNHIIQSCYSTHGARINRHNNIAKYLARIIGDRGATVHEEPHFQTETAGRLKPDLVIYTADRVVVVDVQVINDQYPLGLAHINKIEK
ncbi:Retrovirus-related Pol polyprotein from type-2 retrotransposable element R2DM [Araneus ventricosus]|uniref:Retrovirus-related Pol polyprotein from type-2 retrotransposable element R2DM n=1 Tax=Araneus ventricosus TaxID=182803 RepID=A0A4Y2A5M3_ARAVE|nr:Retrovirus-related Pol polyprotein from type-2 retrotransposable element R2DM [Araneus ventricosus]